MSLLFHLNGIFDTELVHLYLSDSAQMSIKYHWYVKTTRTTKYVVNVDQNRIPSAQGRAQGVAKVAWATAHLPSSSQNSNLIVNLNSCRISCRPR